MNKFKKKEKKSYICLVKSKINRIPFFLLVYCSMRSGFFLKITNPSKIGVNEMYSSVASSARSPYANKTGVVCV